MTAVVVSIVRFVDGHPPGFVECALVDALGQSHLFVEKVPIVTDQALWSDSEPDAALAQKVMDRAHVLLQASQSSAVMSLLDGRTVVEYLDPAWVECTHRSSQVSSHSSPR